MKTTTRSRGAVKHCVYGNCNSDNRPGRPGYNHLRLFLPFPKPCLIFRKLDENERRNILASHLKTCSTCENCDKWMKMCKRSDGRWKTIMAIKKDSYICEDHFVDIKEVPLPLPLSTEEITEMKAKQTFDMPNKKIKLEPTEFSIDISASSIVYPKCTSSHRDAQTSTELFTRTKWTQTTFQSIEEIALRSEVSRLKQENEDLKRKYETK